MSESTGISQIEKVAMTILYHANTELGHPILYYYVHALLGDMHECRTLDEYAESEEWKLEDVAGLTREVESVGWATTNVLDAVLGDARYPERYPSHWRYRDEANARLAIALASYRRNGRPEGEETSAIHGLGGPLVTVVTSLAAAVAEYVLNIQNWWAIQLEEQDEGESQ